MSLVTTLKKNKFDLLYYFVLAIFAFAFVFVCSEATSPLYVDGDLSVEANDACQFMTIGHEWLFGKIPYQDIFDHKGPYIFFVNMLGFGLTGTRTGVFILQVVNMFVILCGLDAIARLHSSSKRYRIVVVVVSLLIMRPTYDAGDRTEEFCLSFIVVSTYFQLKYLLLAKSSAGLPPRRAEGISGSADLLQPPDTLYSQRGLTNDHRPVLAVLYGVTFGVCLMTRATNCITVCAGALCIAAVLLCEKKLKCLLLNVLAFVGGTLLVVAPFSIYFAMMNCFDEYFFATIMFNMLYANAFDPWILSTDLATLAGYLIRTLAFSCVLVAAVVFLVLKQWRLAAYCFICWCLEAYLFFSSAPFTVYAAIATAQVAILFNAASGMKGKWGKFFKVLICGGLILYALLEIAFIVRGAYKTYTEENPAMVPAKEYIQSIPESERQEIMLLGDVWAKPLYLKYGIHPQYKYYNIQEWHSRFSEKVHQEVRDQFAYGDAKYIIADKTKFFIEDILEDRYQLVSENQGIYLYELKETSES